MISVTWESIAVGYASYLAIIAIVSRRFHRARRWTLVAAFASWTVWASAIHAPRLPLADALVPVPILLAGYWLSGLFFVAPMHRLEESLLRIDERFAHRWRAAWPSIVRDYFELAYVLVYAVVPAGALTLVLGGHTDAVPRFWAVVLLAEFVSYGMLPWLQTRPPRAIETAAPTPSSVLRRFNEAVLKRGSIQVNTVPSGHAAGAVATGLAVASAMPTAGVVFLVLAASIAIATVVGRYHYVVDSVLGVIVAAGAWYLIA
jgi:membrane-associated phospholipid phosphatase